MKTQKQEDLPHYLHVRAQALINALQSDGIEEAVALMGTTRFGVDLACEQAEGWAVLSVSKQFLVQQAEILERKTALQTLVKDGLDEKFHDDLDDICIELFELNHGAMEELKYLLSEARDAVDVTARDGNVVAFKCAAVVWFGEDTQALFAMAEGAGLYPTHPHPICVAARHKNLDVLKAAAGVGFDANEVDADSGNSAMHYAIRSGYIETVRYLAGAMDLAHADDYGEKLSMMAAFHNAAEALDILNHAGYDMQDAADAARLAMKKDNLAVLWVILNAKPVVADGLMALDQFSNRVRDAMAAWGARGDLSKDDLFAAFGLGSDARLSGVGA